MSKPNQETLDKLLEAIRIHRTSYWCKWCKRHIPMEDGIFIHDDTYHPADIVFDCGNEHKLQ
jgi:hypothetical protein